jgi:hypothetical protein
VLGVMPIEVPGEIGVGLVVIEEAPGIFWRPFHRAERRLNEGIIVGSPWAGKQLGHTVIFAQPGLSGANHAHRTSVLAWVWLRLEDLLRKKPSRVPSLRAVERRNPNEKWVFEVVSRPGIEPESSV